MAGRNPPSCAPVCLGSRVSGVSHGPARPEDAPDAARSHSPREQLEGSRGMRHSFFKARVQLMKTKERKSKALPLLSPGECWLTRERSRSIPTGAAAGSESHLRGDRCVTGAPCHPWPLSRGCPGHLHHCQVPQPCWWMERALGEPGTSPSRVPAGSQLSPLKQNLL